MHHKRQADFGQKRDARIVVARSMHDHAIHRALGLERAVVLLLGVVRYDRQYHVIVVARIDLAGACNEIRENRIDDFVAGRDRKQGANRHRTTGRKLDSARIWPVIQLFRRSYHPLSRGFIDFRIAVERTADRGGRQAKMRRKLFQFHVKLFPNLTQNDFNPK